MSITITIDGQQYSAQQGDMIIEVADRHKVQIPRFCYHDKLSIAANCRMCLVEVEKAPKPLPACATPVSEGMVVHTKSEKTQLSQKAVMEFLLINHPLDCPICDQGGECELQDLSMKYGYSQSRYKEQKRVAQDFNLGPLVSTDMTRCIHCTRCIRFGSEIAGIQEMGATSRGESTQVGTYLEKHLSSELSANVIDICPVGALTSKPHRSVGRTWELKSTSGVSFLDGFGSNLWWHFDESKLRRILPRNNDDINENWLPDRDRYSLLGMYGEKRLLNAFDKSQNQNISTGEAISLLAEVLTRKSYDSSSLCGVIHPNSTFEEAYLIQKIFRELGSSSIDYRIQEYDVSDQDQSAFMPTLPFSLDTMLNSPLLIIGNYLNHDIPMMAHKIRQSARHGQQVYQLGWSTDKMNIDNLHATAIKSNKLVAFLQGLLFELIKNNESALSLSGTLEEHAVEYNFSPEEKELADSLIAQESINILTSPSISSLPDAAKIRYLTFTVASLKKGQSGGLFYGHSAGCAIAGAHPHHGVISQDQQAYLSGLDYGKMLQDNLEVLVLFNVEPDDVLDKKYLLSLAEKASYVVAFSSFKSKFLEKYADLVIPIAMLAENEGHHINCFGQEQFSKSNYKLVGDVKQAWRALRVLADKAALPGMDYNNVQEIFNEGYRNADNVNFEDLLVPPSSIAQDFESINDVYLNIHIHAFSQCELLRQSKALHQTPYAQKIFHCFMNIETAQKFNLKEGDIVEIKQGEIVVEVPVAIDSKIVTHVVQIYKSEKTDSLLNGYVSLGRV